MSVSFRLTSDVQDFKSSFKLCISQGLRSFTQVAGDSFLKVKKIYIFSTDIKGCVENIGMLKLWEISLS